MDALVVHVFLGCSPCGVFVALVTLFFLCRVRPVTVLARRARWAFMDTLILHIESMLFIAVFPLDFGLGRRGWTLLPLGRL